MTPKRIQLRRTKDWRMPPNTVKVDRSSRHGNPYRVGLVACGCRSAGECGHNTFRCETAREAVDAFQQVKCAEPRYREKVQADLRGKNVGCWCRLCPEHADGLPLGAVCINCAPCHGDPLLEVANG